MFGSQLNQKAAKTATELRNEYLNEMEQCVQKDEMSKKLEKLIKELGYTGEQVDADEADFRMRPRLEAEVKSLGEWRVEDWLGPEVERLRKELFEAEDKFRLQQHMCNAKGTQLTSAKAHLAEINKRLER